MICRGQSTPSIVFVQENVLLKRQIDASTTEAGAQMEAGERAKAAEDKFSKLREVYQKLRSEHITLLRKSSETAKQLTTANHHISETEEQAKVHCNSSALFWTNAWAISGCFVQIRPAFIAKFNRP